MLKAEWYHVTCLRPVSQYKCDLLLFNRCHVVLSFFCRAYEHEHGCNSSIFFHTTTSEKGDKSVSNTEVLLLLQHDGCDKVTEIIGNASAEPVRAILDEVTTKNFRSTFRCYLWGDVSAWAFMACVAMTGDVVVCGKSRFFWLHAWCTVAVSLQLWLPSCSCRP